MSLQGSIARLASRRLLVAMLLAIFAAVAAATPAFASGGDVSGSGAWSWWVFDPLAITTFVGLGVLYYRGLCDWKKRSRPLHRWQVVSFYTGLTALFLALVSPIDPISDHLFLVHMGQHVILRVLAPALMILGAPVTPVLRGLPLEFRMSVVKPLVSHPGLRRIYRLFQNPVLVPGLYLITLFFWALPATQDAAVNNFGLHYLMHLSLTSTSFMFWWLIIDPRPHRSTVHYGVRILIMGLTLLPNTILGAIVVFANSIQYHAYGTARLWGISPIDDQRGGALIQWLVVDMMSLAVAIVIFIMWYQSEQNADRERIRKRKLQRALRPR